MVLKKLVSVTERETFTYQLGFAIIYEEGQVTCHIDEEISGSMTY